MGDRPTLDGTFYGTAAGLYDLLATAPGIRSWRTRAVETLALDRGDTVVEMGCGTGANFPALREAVGARGRVVGVDLVPAMLRRAQRRIDDAGWSNVDVVRGDATQPPITEADGLISTFVVGMLEDPKRAVRTWIQCVDAGGRVTLLNATRTRQGYARLLNVPFRLFVRLGAPGNRLSRQSPARRLEQRWEAASGVLFEGTTDHHEHRLGLGLVALASGRVSDA
jgi:ubiquinone/menaquinone biosynthesis C-methylase UbiE